MRSPGLLGLAAAVLAGLVAVLAVAARDDRELAFTLGVRPVKTVARLAPGQRACQSSLFVQKSFRGVGFEVGPAGGDGVPIDVTVRRGGSLLASGRLWRGYPAPSMQDVRLDRTVPGEIEGVAVCLRNRGDRPAAISGDIATGLGRGELRVGGRERDADLRLVFLRERSRSALALVPEMFRRAALFRPAWVGAWTFWALLALVAAGIPLLLARALSAAAGDQAGVGSRSRSAERSASST